MPFDYQAMKQHLEAGSSPNETNSLGEGLLHTYLREENPTVEGVRLLFENGADPNLLSQYNNTPLHLYFRQKYPRYDIVKLCIENGANVNLKGEPYFDEAAPEFFSNQFESSMLDTYLREAREIDLQMLELLLKHGADPSMWCTLFRAPLFTCLRRHTPNLKAIELLIQYGADLNRTSEYGSLPIHHYLGLHRSFFSQAPLDLRVINYLFQYGTKPDLFFSLRANSWERKSSKVKVYIAFMLLAAGLTIQKSKGIEAFALTEDDFLDNLNHLNFFKQYLREYLGYHLTDDTNGLAILPVLRSIMGYIKISKLIDLSKDLTKNPAQNTASIVKKYADYFWMQDMSTEVVRRVADILQKPAHKKETIAEWKKLLSTLDSDTKQNVTLLQNMILKLPKEILLLIREHRAYMATIRSDLSSQHQIPLNDINALIRGCYQKEVNWPDFMDAMTECLIPLSRGP